MGPRGEKKNSWGSAKRESKIENVGRMTNKPEFNVKAAALIEHRDETLEIFKVYSLLYG